MTYELDKKNLLDIYDLIFTDVHSDGFKVAEIKDLLFDNTYWFLAKPKDNWQSELMSYLNKIDYDKSKLNMNPNFLLTASLNVKTNNMIQANELRVGNLVEANSPMMQVKEITEHTVGLYMPGSEADSFFYDIEQINPIPLSPEILEKFGFKEVFTKDWYSIRINDESYLYSNPRDGFGLTIENKDEETNTDIEELFIQLPHIKYLHQLQNIYFALTGEELPHTTTLLSQL